MTMKYQRNFLTRGSEPASPLLLQNGCKLFHYHFVQLRWIVVNNVGVNLPIFDCQKQYPLVKKTLQGLERLLGAPSGCLQSATREGLAQWFATPTDS